MEEKSEDNSFPYPKNILLGKEILDQCSDEKIAAHLSTMINLPQVDGALYGIYYGRGGNASNF